MAAGVSIKVDLSELGDFLPKFAQATRQSLAEVVRQQARLLLRDEGGNGIIKFTPPIGEQEAKAKGDATIRRDIHRVFLTRASALEIAKRSNVRGLKAAFRNNDHAKILDLLNKTQPGSVRVKGYERNGKQVAGYTQTRPVSSLNNNRLGFLSSVSEAPDRAVHKSRQDINKHVRRNRWSQLVLSKGALTAYISEIQKRVGTMKAGWRPAARALQLNVPSFVANVQRASGSVKIELGGDNPSVTMINSTPRADRVAAKAIDFVRAGREQAMKTNLEKILAVQASKLP
jgi:hypothetical protein